MKMLVLTGVTILFGISFAKECQRFVPDTVTYVPNGFFFISKGDSWWTLDNGKQLQFDPGRGNLSDLCADAKRIDLAMWWGMPADTFGCNKRTVLKGFSLLLMERSKGLCRWCYALNKQQDNSWTDAYDYIFEGPPTLEKFIKFVDINACSDLIAADYQLFNSNKEKRVLAVVGDKILNWYCQQAIPSSKWKQIWAKPIGEVYEGLPSLDTNRLLSFYSNSSGAVMKYMFIFNDGSIYQCPKFYDSSTLPIRCKKIDEASYFFGVCDRADVLVDPTEIPDYFSTSESTTNELLPNITNQTTSPILPLGNKTGISGTSKILLALGGFLGALLVVLLTCGIVLWCRSTRTDSSRSSNSFSKSFSTNETSTSDKQKVQKRNL